MMNIVPIDTHSPESGSLLDYALRYAAIDWKLVPCWWIEEGACACGKTDCKSPGKHPIGTVVPFGQNSASNDPATIRKWLLRYPKANIAAYLSPSGLCAIDIDPRNGGYDTIDDLESRHGRLESDLLQLTGGGGEHRVFQAPAAGHLPGKLGPGIDVKQNGYIMLEPSNHMSGKLYEWEASSSPLDGCTASPLPDWVRDLSAPAMLGAGDDGSEKTRYPLSEDDIAQIGEAVQFIPSDDRDTWLTIGMAIHAAIGGQRGFSMWDQWSQSSSKYNPVDLTRVWRSFRVKGLSGVNKGTLFDLAQKHGWNNPGPVVELPAPVQITEIKVAASPDPVEFGFTLPGILGEVEAWINATSRKPQPAFATQAALAFGATVLGRKFVTTQRNWPSLYFLNIGKSASGKEHAKWAIESLLEACGLDKLIGPASYTSNSGVLSALCAQPSHVTVIDEFGKVLEASTAKNNARAASAITMLMEAWGRADGTIRPQGYSTFGMSQSDADKLASRSVRNPALTVLAMTTPETFFDAIGSAAARDGFLNRFLIVESDIGRQAGQHVNQTPVPQSVIDWATEIHSVQTMADVDQPSAMAATPKVIPFSKAALDAFKAFELACIQLMDEHDQTGLSEMFGRSNEIAMRLSLILAVGCGRTEIGQVEADASIRYVQHHAKRTVERLKTAVSDSEFEAISNQVLEVITRAGEKGATEREINQRSRKFKAVDQRMKLSVLNNMAFTGDIIRCEFPSQRGGKRIAWITVDNP
jgi:hypothetical protein